MIIKDAILAEWKKLANILGWDSSLFVISAQKENPSWATEGTSWVWTASISHPNMKEAVWIHGRDEEDILRLSKAELREVTLGFLRTIQEDCKKVATEAYKLEIQAKEQRSKATNLRIQAESLETLSVMECTKAQEEILMESTNHLNVEETVRKVRSFLNAKKDEIDSEVPCCDDSCYANLLCLWLEKEEIRARLEELTGLKLLGTGSFRIVFALDEERVLKIEYTRNDSEEENFVGQNAIEIKAWNESGKRLRQKLAPVLVYGEDWLIMSRTQPNKSEKQIKQAEKLGDLILDENMCDANTGVYEGRVVLHDYGFLERYLSKDRYRIVS